MSEDLEEHDADEHAKLVMEAMRHLADQQIARAERLRTGARQIFVYISGLFTIGQVAAFTGFAKNSVDPSEQTTLIWAAIVATFLLAATGILAVMTDSIKRVPDMSPADILTEADKAIDEDEPFTDRLTKIYLDAAKSRKDAIDERHAWLIATQWVAGAAVIAIVAEIAISLYVRLP